MLLSEFDFSLPPELIAQNPPKIKGQSKMLVFESNEIIDSHFSNLLDFLQEKDVLVFNDAKVIKAKLIGKIARNNASIEFNLDQIIDSTKFSWRAICKGSKKIKDDDEIIFGDGFGAKIAKKLDDGFCILEFEERNFDENLQKYGQVPLPPYIKREENPTLEDEENYQTVYAKNGQAVAAPTAGLHFSDEFLAKLEEKGVKKAFVTLNVGAGTFLPVRSEKITKHQMHEEYFEISQEAAKIINEAKRVIAVGTTSLRVLESCCDENGIVKACKERTKIFIYPGYKFKAVDAILTNFHLPKSTLFMLVCAAIGKENAFKIYQHAIDKKYRFFSYGDCSFFKVL